MNRKIFFGTNLKMYKDIQETSEYLSALSNLTKDINRDEIEIFVIPSFTTLNSCKNAIGHQNIVLGAQNMAWEEEGQYTGEVSPKMLKEVGVKLVMIGHSERRQIFKETDEQEGKKVRKALESGFSTLLCIGETLEQKNYGVSGEVLAIQLKTALNNLDATRLEQLRIAYEPIWSIGVNGIPAAPEYAGEMAGIIREVLKDLFGEAGNDIPILYGGSVNPDNAEILIKQKNIDGLFVGRSAWQAEKFDKLIRALIKAVRD